MTERVRQFIEREGLLCKDGLYLVAVSGGADSVCLLLMLMELGYRVEAVHCNFRLRGEESQRDEAFVKALCEQRDIPLHLTHFDTTTYAELHKVSIEMAARELRYRYFEQLRQDIGANGICVAHHQDDSVETILLNLTRGTGLRGLQGIRPRRGNIIRPLLCVSRLEIEEWLKERDQDYVTDSTNLLDEVTRNKLRLNVIPALRQLSPQVGENILTTARRVGEAMKVYDDAIQNALHSLVKPLTASIGQIVLSAQDDGKKQTAFVPTAIHEDELMAQPSPESILYEWLSPAGFSAATIDDIYLALGDKYKTMGRTNRYMSLQGALQSTHTTTGRQWKSATHWLVRDRGRLLLSLLIPQASPLVIPECGTYIYGDNTKIRVSLMDGAVIERDSSVCCLDASKVLFPLTVRPLREGDRFCPLGMKGTKTVSDYMKDRHKSLIDKHLQLVVCASDGSIVWLVGERLDNRFCITSSTMRTLQVHFLPACR